MEDNLFYNDLLEFTKNQFYQSPVYHKQLCLNHRWNYAVCATPIRRNNGIIFGINWGGNKNTPQTKMPDGSDIITYHFIQRCKQPLVKYWDIDFELINFNYINLCFFRSPRYSCLSHKDYELSLPLFKSFVEYVNPPWLLSVGGTNFKILESFGALSMIKSHYDDERKFKGLSGILWNKWRIYSVPHPSARIKSESRETIWFKVSKEKSFDSHIKGK